MNVDPVRIAISIWLSLMLTTVSSQEDLLSLLGKDANTYLTTAIFKSTRIINSQSIENTAKGVLDIKIQHRFASIENGVSDFFGLDGASIRLGLEYGMSNRLMLGFGRSSLDKAIDGYFKYRILRQSFGKKQMPLSLSIVSALEIKTTPFSDTKRKNYFSSRLYYSYQLVLARKFSDGFSLQLMPTLLHRNLVKLEKDHNDIVSLGIGFRQKLTKRTSLNVEYFYNLPNQLPSNFYAPLSIGFDIETGGHVFQLHFTNASAMIYKGFIAETPDQWTKGQIHFGFNISRVFTLSK